MNPLAASDLLDRPRAESLRIACRLMREGRQAIGLLPASHEVIVGPIAIELGAALARAAGTPIAVIDASAPTTLRQDDLRPAFRTDWHGATLAVLTPQSGRPACTKLEWLERLIEMHRGLFAHLIVDLSAFQSRGEHTAAIDLLDGVVLVCNAGATRDVDLFRAARELPSGHNVGALLVGAGGA